MKITLNRPCVASIICMLLISVLPSHGRAETVSILSASGGSEALLVEAAMKRLLRAEGYTVKGGTTDGYLLVINVMSNTVVGGYKRGVVGHVMVSSASWQALGDELISDRCKGDQETARKFRELLGASIVFIDSNIAQAPDEESLAELLSTYANQKIRRAAAKVTDLLKAMDNNYSREVNTSPEIMR